jgi:hypothetical protein
MKPQSAEQDSTDKKSDELPEHWGLVQGAIWMLGIAALAITGWWWPGIMIVVAISLLTEAAVRYAISKQSDQVDTAAAASELAERRTEALPDTCPNCGSPATLTNADWTGPLSANCAFCGAALPMHEHD